MNMKMLLLDDHPLVRSALESVIQSMGRQVTLVTAATAAQAQAAWPTVAHRPGPAGPAVARW
ncbi:MAG: DNA-binding response regulator [Betaproteobacteria bacterium]|nr:DNA-binding response regulator [Betaproteobacteria bacterium]